MKGPPPLTLRMTFDGPRQPRKDAYPEWNKGRENSGGGLFTPVRSTHLSVAAKRFPLAQRDPMRIGRPFALSPARSRRRLPYRPAAALTPSSEEPGSHAFRETPSARAQAAHRGGRYRR